jgi:hypothetical protein
LFVIAALVVACVAVSAACSGTEEAASPDEATGSMGGAGAGGSGATEAAAWRSACPEGWPVGPDSTIGEGPWHYPEALGGGGQGSGGGGAWGGGEPTSACHGLEGPVTLRTLGSSTVYGEEPYVLFREQAGTCTAVVATPGFLARPYHVSFSPTSVVLRPDDVAARGGSVSTSEHHLTHWEEIRFDYDATGLELAAMARVFSEYFEEDVGEGWHEDIEVGVAILDAPSLVAPACTLPWRAFSVVASPVVADLAANLRVAPPAWTIRNTILPGAVGIIESRVAPPSSWDDVRGVEASVQVIDGLTALDGRPFPAIDLPVHVVDTGPPMRQHDMKDLSALVGWGSVERYDFGHCSSAGCVSIRGPCGRYDGIAGQLDTTAATEAVLTMRVDERVGYTMWPAFERIELVGQDGMRLDCASEETSPDSIERVWTYDVSGYSHVAFAIEVSSYCHGWGEALIVDDIRVR